MTYSFRLQRIIVEKSKQESEEPCQITSTVKNRTPTYSHTARSFLNCLRIQLTCCTFSHLGKHALNNILISNPCTCPKCQWLVLPSPCQASMTTPCSSDKRAQFLLRPYMVTGLFSLQSMSKPLPFLPCLYLFLLGPGRSACAFLPSTGLWISLMTNQTKHQLGNRTFASEPPLHIGGLPLSATKVTPHRAQSSATNKGNPWVLVHKQNKTFSSNTQRSQQWVISFCIFCPQH